MTKAKARRAMARKDGVSLSVANGEATTTTPRARARKERKASQKVKERKGGKKGGQSSGKGKGVCRLCHQPGHSGNECPNQGQVHQVTNSNGNETPTITLTGNAGGGNGRKASSSTVQRCLLGQAVLQL